MKTIIILIALALAFWLGYEYALYEVAFYNQRPTVREVLV